MAPSSAHVRLYDVPFSQNTLSPGPTRSVSPLWSEDVTFRTLFPVAASHDDWRAFHAVGMVISAVFDSGR